MNKILTAIELLIFGAAIAIGAFLVFSSRGDLKDYALAKQEYSQIASDSVRHISEESSAGSITGSDGEIVSVNDIPSESVDYLINTNIDFQSLKQQNSDVVAWILIPDSICNYPIVQTTDDEAYLNTTFFGKQSSSGCIFMDSDCNPDFTSNNTIIYGHNMKNGTMFRPIRAYKDRSYYASHPYIYLYTPSKSMECNIVAVLEGKPNKNLYQRQFATQTDYDNFLDTIKKASLYEAYPAKHDKRIFTLSTCSGVKGENRFLIFLQVNRTFEPLKGEL